MAEREARMIEGAQCDTIQYAHTAATSAGEVIFVSGIGALVNAGDALDANEEGTYYKAGRFQCPVATSTTAQGDQLYWDVSANKLIAKSSTSRTSDDFFFGTAAIAGTNTAIAAGYADVDLNVVLPTFFLDTVGVHTCVNTIPVPGDTLETITVTGLTTYDAVSAMMQAQSSTAGCHVNYAKASAANTLVVGLSTTGTSTGTIAYRVYRRVAVS
jgi:hypothetical protein